MTPADADVIASALIAAATAAYKHALQADIGPGVLTNRSARCFDHSALKWLLILAVLGYGGLLALMYVFQRALMYFPDPTRTAPAQAGLPQAEEVPLTSSDGETLIAWHVPPRRRSRW